MSETQFPPSSPVLNAADIEDPFSGKCKNTSARGREHVELPTPNPSSSVFRSSSPSRHEHEEERFSSFVPVPIKSQSVELLTSAKPKSVSINKAFNILNPDKTVMRIPLLAARPQIAIGRSSKACDYYLRASQDSNSMDKTVSRRHVLIQHSASKLTVKCLGYNGFMMMVPKMCQITKKSGSDDDVYVLRETTKPLAKMIESKTIRLEENNTEFYVMRNESIEMPRFANVLLQIRDHIVLLNPDDYDEDLTDNETSEESQVIEAYEPVGKTSASIVSVPTVKPYPDIGNISTPETFHRVTPRTPNKANLKCDTSGLEDETTPSVKKQKKTLSYGIESEKENAHNQIDIKLVSGPDLDRIETKRPTTPLANRSTNLPKNAPIKRRAASEEPSVQKKPKKVATHDVHGKLIISQDCIRNVTNIKEIENILVNHLAFSRLSSTPASVLNTILATVAKLSLPQLRTVLHNASCIGVIYRQGKDAAGKPLEEEYFYEPEKDQDSQRILLLSLIKGHGGLRACRKTHKQYYWKKPAAKK